MIYRNAAGWATSAKGGFNMTIYRTVRLKRFVKFDKPISGPVRITYHIDRDKNLIADQIDKLNLLPEPEGSYITTLDFKARFDNPNKLHAYIENCFPNDVLLSKRLRILWQLEDGHLTIFSRHKPWRAVLRLLGDNIVIKEAKTYYPKGTRLNFTLKTRPVKSNGTTGRLTPLKTANEIFNWMKGKASQSGFTLGYSRYIKGYFSYSHRGTEIGYPYVVFKGTLTVEDPELFEQALTAGIGKSRAIGFGMLKIEGEENV